MHTPLRTPTARLAAIFAVASLLFPAALAAEDHKTESIEEAAPDSVAGEIGKLLQEKGTRVLDEKGKPFLDVWLCKELEVRDGAAALGVDFTGLTEGMVLGVVKYHATGYDFRDNKIPAGVYTMRYGRQPEDGDHLGVSETRDYVLLSPGKEDKKPGALTYDDLVELSAKSARGRHPSILWLVKTDGGKEKDLPRIVKKTSRDYVTLDCSVPASKKDAPPVRMGIVIVGYSPDA